MSIVVVSLLGTLLSSGSVLVGPAPEPPPAPAAPSRVHRFAPEPPRPPEPPRAPRAPGASRISRAHGFAPSPPRPPHPPRIVVAPHGPGSSGMTWSVTVGGPRLGTQVSTMTSQLRDFFGAPDDAGLLVQGIESDSAAEAAGVRVGDVIVEVDGQPIDRVADVRRALAEHGDGDEVAVVVVRRKKRKTLKATLSRASSATVVRSGDEPAIVREQVEQQLEQARQQLREAERRLEHLERSKRGASEAPQGEPPRGKKTRRLRRKSKSKSKSSAD